MNSNIFLLLGAIIAVGAFMSTQTTSGRGGGRTMRRHQRGGKSKKHRKH